MSAKILDVVKAGPLEVLLEAGVLSSSVKAVVEPVVVDVEWITIRTSVLVDLTLLGQKTGEPGPRNR